MTYRKILPAVVLLSATVALTACGGDPDRPSTAAPTATSADSAAPPPTSPEATAAATAGPESSGAPSDEASTESSSPKLPLSPPPIELPPRQAGEPSAREVIAAFRAAGLKVANSRDRSEECGPDGLGLGCSELVVTDGIAVYVFPDEGSAIDMAERWDGVSHRKGTVVLNYLKAPTPKAERPRYEKVLDDLR
ncbi:MULTISPECIES: hypothetical protein [Micromonospora]|uniref:hypothetical protein n=1 Tax=Micromonospora TaxID=1873 RepID=UPI000C882538|nr:MULTISPECIES: hypothetical protein [Micromonospora]PMR58952.1 hypothetical protein C1A38_21895 [Verrucosispora sp. ts21]